MSVGHPHSSHKTSNLASIVSIPSLKLVVWCLFAGLKFNKDAMCIALKDAGIETPDWVKIAEHLQVGIKLQVSADDFLQGWYAYANELQPSSMKLAEALEKTGIPKCKEAAKQIRMKQGIVVIRSIRGMALTHCTETNFLSCQV